MWFNLLPRCSHIRIYSMSVGTIKVFKNQQHVQDAVHVFVFVSVIHTKHGHYTGVFNRTTSIFTLLVSHPSLKDQRQYTRISLSLSFFLSLSLLKKKKKRKEKETNFIIFIKVSTNFTLWTNCFVDCTFCCRNFPVLRMFSASYDKPCTMNTFCFN